MTEKTFPLLTLALYTATSLLAQNTPPVPRANPPSASAPAATVPALPPQAPDVAAPKMDPKTGDVNAGFLTAHNNFVKIAKENQAKLLFLGDSITAGWGGKKDIWNAAFEQYKPANFGIGGDRTQHVLWRILNGELDGFFFLDIGDKFLEPDGSISKDTMHDFLHLTNKGYQIWADAIAPSLAKLMQ